LVGRVAQECGKSLERRIAKAAIAALALLADVLVSANIEVWLVLRIGLLTLMNTKVPGAFFHNLPTYPCEIRIEKGPLAATF